MQDPGGASYRLGAPPPVVPPGRIELPLAPFGVLKGVIGAVLQKADEMLKITENVEDVAPAGNLGQGQCLAGAQTQARIGDGGIGSEALIDQLQQAHAPGFSVAVVLQTKQVAVGRRGVDAHQYWKAGLEDFVVGTDAHATQIATAVDRPSRFDGAGDDVVHRTQGDAPVEEVAEQFDDSAVRAVADQHQGQDELPQPSLGHG